MKNQPQNSMDGIISDPELKGQLKKLVLERVNAMPENLRVAVGSFSRLTKNDLADHVREEDEIGKQVIEMELDFLRDLASGAVYATG